MALAKFEAPPSTGDALSKALGIATGVFGIKHNIDASKLANAQTAQAQQKTDQEATTFGQAQDEIGKLQDPNSTESKLTKGEGSALLGFVKSSAAYKKDPTIVDNLTSLINDPNTSGLQVKKYIADSPFLKDIVSANGKDMSLQYLATAMANKNVNTQEKTDLSANKQYQTVMAPYENTIQAANRAQHIIGKIRNGELKSTPTLSSDLNAAVGSMFNNGKGATVYSMSHSDQDSLFKRLQTGAGFISGSPVDTLPMGQLDQLDKDIGSLKNSYLDAHDVAYTSMKEGLPERVKQSLDKRFSTFRQKAGALGSQPSEDTKSGSGLPGVSDAAAGTAGPPPKAQDIFSAAQAELAKRRANKK